MSVTVIRDLVSAAKKFKQIIEEGKAIKEIIEESKYYRHPDSATISYAKIAEESIGKISDKDLNIGIVGAGPSGICALYELSKIDHNKKIKVSLYESDPKNFIFSGEFGDLIPTRAGRVSATMASSRAVYEVGAMRFPETAGLTWYYAGKVFGVKKKVNPFPNPGAVTTEFVFGDRVDHYIGGDWEDPDSPALKVKELVANKLWEGDYKIGNRTPKDVSTLLKSKDTLPQTLKDIHSDWKTFVTKYDGTTLGSAVHNIIFDSIDKLPGISGLSSLAERVNYYFELFGHFGFGTGPFKPVFNMSIVEMMRLLLWDYSSEYLFPVGENVDFIKELYKEVLKNKEGFDIKNIHVKVCDVFHRMDEKLAGVAYYDLEKDESEPRGQNPYISYHDYVILAIPQVPATRIISSFGSTTVRIYNGEVGTPKEAANAQLTAAIDSLHMTRSAKVFATIQKIKADEAPKFKKKPIQAILSDCGLASSYMLSLFDDVFGKMIDRSYRWIRDVSDKDNKYKLWWLCDFLKSVENIDKFFFDWSAQSSAGAFKLDLANDHYRSDLCFRYHTHATSKALDNRFFLASCSYSHLGGWLEGAFMSAINAVSGIVVAANGGGQEGINALNSEAQKLFTDLDPVIPEGP
ncbi:39276_t:CDS:2 [Gigaspora margarita]|uniref:39276_t:CDS:1 n=1 Tax=Gigaspora margarita TaxID=4874 RepID=A0ABN7UKY5_GIGMA|nr:39276_t:CDS:2 [Gigaspora margarita]